MRMALRHVPPSSDGGSANPDQTEPLQAGLAGVHGDSRLTAVAAGQGQAGAVRAAPPLSVARTLRLRRLVDDYLDFVARVLRNAGTPSAEIDDEVQRTFIIAARRLDDVRPGAERAFLLQIALHLAAHARRTLARRREISAETLPEISERLEAPGNPEHLMDQKRIRQMLDRVLDKLQPDLRVVFVLFEFEEMSSSEVAEALGIPRGTVASRLRRVRSLFQTYVRQLQGVTEGGV